MSIIGISGKLNSGKDTVAKIIQWLESSFDKEKGLPFLLSENYEYSSNFKVKKFADKLKDIVCLLINCSRDDLESQEFKEKELGEEWWYFRLKVPHHAMSNTLVYSGNLFTSEKEAWDYCDNIIGYSRTICQIEFIKLTPRLLLQFLGTNVLRDQLHPSIWINSLFSEYKEKKPYKGISVDYMISECIDCKTSFSGEKGQFICNDCYDTHNWFPKWIITDLRFPNELSEVKKRKGVTIRVNRFPAENKMKHESETSLDHIDDWDFVIDNNGSIEELVEQVKIIYNQIKNDR